MTREHRAVSILAPLAILAISVTHCDKGSSDSQQHRPPPDARTGLSPAFANAEAKGIPMPLAGTKAVFYNFGPADSKIEFTGAKITKKHQGSFGAFHGRIGFVGESALLSAVTVEIDVTSLTVDPEKLATHLKGADFLDVAKFPKATFSSTTIRPGADATHFNVTGRLDLHGVSKPITFPAAIHATAEQLDVDAEFPLYRKDFGIVYPGAPDDLIKDDVLIKLTLHAKPMKAQATPPADARAAD